MIEDTAIPRKGALKRLVCFSFKLLPDRLAIIHGGLALAGDYFNEPKWNGNDNEFAAVFSTVKNP